MLDKMFPFYVAAIATVIAHILKPITHYMIHKEWDISYMFEAGGMPSSHVAAVSALCVAVGLVEKFSSTIFAVTLTFSIVIAFDAANVRYYAGQNIKLTKKLIEDLNELGQLKTTDPIYNQKMKEVLGHTYFEVFAGLILGVSVSLIYYLLFVGGK